MTRVLIADSHPVVRFGLRSIIESRAGWTVVAEAADGIEATDGAIVTQPDVAILDYALPVLNGIEATHQIRRRVPNVEVLIFTMHDNEDLVRQAFNAGARAYVLKSEAQQQLVSAIEALAMHRPFVRDAAAQIRLRGFLSRTSRVERRLTGREHTIVRMVAEGLSNKQIAQELKIAVKTVETHRATILRKLDLGSSAEMVRYAIRNGLIRA
jgi:DNA-binding NarL/FixJ family response regulator